MWLPSPTRQKVTHAQRAAHYSAVHLYTIERDDAPPLPAMALCERQSGAEAFIYTQSFDYMHMCVCVHDV